MPASVTAQPGGSVTFVLVVHRSGGSRSLVVPGCRRLRRVLPFHLQTRHQRPLKKKTAVCARRFEKGRRRGPTLKEGRRMAPRRLIPRPIPS